MELFFCDQCEKRIPTAEVAEAKAQAAALSDRMYCAECRPKPVAAPVAAVAPKPATATHKAPPRSTVRLARPTPSNNLGSRKSPIRGTDSDVDENGFSTPIPIRAETPGRTGTLGRAGTSGYKSPAVQVAPPQKALHASASNSAARAVAVPERRKANTLPLIAGVALCVVCLIIGGALFFGQNDKPTHVAAVEPEAKKVAPATPDPVPNAAAVSISKTTKSDDAKPAAMAAPATPANPIAKRVTPAPDAKPKAVTPPPAPKEAANLPVAADVPELTVEALKGGAPKIDGLLDDAAWRTAANSDALKFENGDTPKGKARFWVTYDDTNLYVAVQCFEDATALSSLKADATQASPDNIWMDDSVELFIDPSNSRRDYYQFIFNSKGVIWKNYYDAPKHAAFNWSPTAEVAANIGKLSWTVEAAIPLSAFNHTPKFSSDWAFNLAHTRTAANELMYWSPVHNESSHRPERFGKLKGMPKR